MARGGKKDGNAAAAAAADPVVEERLRLKKLAFSKSILSQTQAKVGASAALAPSKTLIKHHGKDILRKSQRKNRYLFSFPGLLGPISGGKIGELKDLGTKNPILYLDFPQGQMKLFGTIVYPKNRYLTLQFSKGGKNVTCDDYFDNMIVFSEAWWIGKKEDNPEELQLQFPTELNKENHTEYDFKGGVGVMCDSKQSSGKFAPKSLEREPPKVDTDDDITDSPNDYKELAEVTPARQSARTVGKTYKFTESLSGDDFIGNEDDTPEEDDDEVDNETIRNAPTGSPCRLVFEDDNNDNTRNDPASGQNKRTGNAEDSSDNGHRSLVQTTLSSLFKKVEDKKVKKDVKKKIASSEVRVQTSKHMKGGKKIEGRKSGTATKKQKKQPEDEDDDIEEISSASQDIDGSDEDWTS